MPTITGGARSLSRAQARRYLGGVRAQPSLSFETHGFYWRGVYHFGNIPLVNYLPNSLRNKLCPHVRAYTRAGLRQLFQGLDGQIVVHRRIFAGYDNIIARWPRLGRFIRSATYALESTPLQALGLSHFLVYRKAAEQAIKSRQGSGA